VHSRDREVARGIDFVLELVGGDRDPIDTEAPAADIPEVASTQRGLVDKNAKGKRARQVSLTEPFRDLVNRRIELAGNEADARLFTGPKGGPITTARPASAHSPKNRGPRHTNYDPALSAPRPAGRD
jgi:integrase